MFSWFTRLEKLVGDDNSSHPLAMATLNRGKMNSASLEDTEQLFLETWNTAGSTQVMAETADIKNIQMRT